MNLGVGWSGTIKFRDHASTDDIDGLPPPGKPNHIIAVKGIVVYEDEHYVSVDLADVTTEVDGRSVPTVRWDIVKGAIISTRKARKK